MSPDRDTLTHRAISATFYLGVALMPVLAWCLTP